MHMLAQSSLSSLQFMVGSITTLALIVSSWGTPWATSPEVLVEVNGETIDQEELDRSLGVKLIQLQEQMYKLKRSELDLQIEQRLLEQEAVRRGVSVATLLDAEVTAKVTLVTEAEIATAYQANKARFVGSEALIRDKLRSSVQQQKLATQRQTFVTSLKSQANIVDRLQAPSVVRLAVATDGAPVVGPVDAPVTLVEFSDFHCPFCMRVEQTLKNILERYPSKVRLVYRQFPIQGLHPQARPASEASLCAHDQGKFWEYHDVLFAQAPKAGDDDLKQYAKDVGLDTEKFSSCLFRSAYHEAVQRDIDEANRLGIEGTPAFFINGRFLNGAQPMEKFVQIIEDELARAESGTVSMRKQ